MPGSHQVAAAVFAGADQIPGGFLRRVGNGYGGDLTQMQQPGQMRGITGSVLTRSPDGRINFDGAATSQLDPAALKARAKPNPVGPAS